MYVLNISVVQQILPSVKIAYFPPLYSTIILKKRFPENFPNFFSPQFYYNCLANRYMQMYIDFPYGWLLILFIIF